jgi:hypothetical protein
MFAGPDNEPMFLRHHCTPVATQVNLIEMMVLS